MAFIASAREAEINAAARMREFGFGDALATPIGADGGVDVRSSRAIAEVKWKSAQAGRPEVQKLFGARGTKQHLQMFFFAAGGFSKGAVQYANESDVKLFTYDPNGVVTPANSVATTFVQRLEREKAAKDAADAAGRKKAEKEKTARARRERPKSTPPESPKPSPKVDDFAAKREQIKAELVAQEKRESKRRKNEAKRSKRDLIRNEKNARNHAQLVARQRRDQEIRSRGKVPSSRVIVALLWIPAVVLPLFMIPLTGGIVTGLLEAEGVQESIIGTVVAAVFIAIFVWLMRVIIRSLRKREIA
ncbi:restriction endonuclease [Rhodococcus erythropolis]|uniref:restriction endonuclease n=1 Tax=Rhodococcus erythropolis TaxID=1833 RepID=UPI001F24A36E|nr:restriction endonuclease [Rhodococcus erythropolis]UJC78349.1 restriction endonuclease [Rhodococcus erythropolis]